MKKTIILAATFFALYSAKAQKTIFGIKGGLNASTISSNPGNSNLETKIGFNVGLLAHIHTSDPMWAIQPEVYYSLEGAKNKSNSNVSYGLGYLNVPVLAQLMFDNGFRVEAGPQIGFLMNANYKVNNTTTTVTNNYRKANFSIPLGLGYVSSSGLGVDARYNFGISDINNTNSSTKIHSNVFQIGLFYQFSNPGKKH